MGREICSSLHFQVARRILTFRTEILRTSRTLSSVEMNAKCRYLSPEEERGKYGHRRYSRVQNRPYISEEEIHVVRKGQNTILKSIFWCKQFWCLCRACAVLLLLLAILLGFKKPERLTAVQRLVTSALSCPIPCCQRNVNWARRPMSNFSSRRQVLNPSPAQCPGHHTATVTRLPFLHFLLLCCLPGSTIRHRQSDNTQLHFDGFSAGPLHLSPTAAF